MPRGGAIALSDVAGDRLTVVCPLCHRRGIYQLARLFKERGDARLTDLLTAVTANCPRTPNRDTNRCQARYEGLVTKA